MEDHVIYNCHAHIFTHENAPNRLFPLYGVVALRVKPLRWILSGLMKLVVPHTANDRWHRFSAFLDAAYRKTQRQNLEHLIGYYPNDMKEHSKFIILPMDYSNMGAGGVKEDIDEQHAELAELARDRKYAELLIPFAHIDPRRLGAFVRLQSLVERDGFKGVKIYPTLGYRPDYRVLMNDIYPYMVEKNLPLLAHCSPGSTFNRKLGREKAYACADPANYVKVMERFPKLKICLGHFGGIEEWKRELNETRDPQHATWMKKICELIKCGRYPNLYTDISYTIFNFQENVPLLAVLMEDEAIQEKVLFGSDFYAVENQAYSEKRLSTDLRYALGEEKFWKIANKNPRAYLGRP